MHMFEWHTFRAGDAAPLAMLFRAAVTGLAAPHYDEGARRSFERAGFQMLVEERVQRNGVSLARFRMRKPLDAAHTQT